MGYYIPAPTWLQLSAISGSGNATVEVTPVNYMILQQEIITQLLMSLLAR
jgi:hypothetical protein